MDLLQTAALLDCNMINGRTHTNRQIFSRSVEANTTNHITNLYLLKNKVLSVHDAATNRHLPFCMIGLCK